MLKDMFTYDLLTSGPLTNKEFEEDFLKRIHKDYNFDDLPEVKYFSALSYCTA